MEPLLTSLPRGISFVHWQLAGSLGVIWFMFSTKKREKEAKKKEEKYQNNFIKGVKKKQELKRPINIFD